VKNLILSRSLEEEGVEGEEQTIEGATEVGWVDHNHLPRLHLVVKAVGKEAVVGVSRCCELPLRCCPLL